MDDAQRRMDAPPEGGLADRRPKADGHPKVPVGWVLLHQKFLDIMFLVGFDPVTSSIMGR